MLSIAQVRARGGYRIIYADPGWEYDDHGIRGAAEGHYTTTGDEALAALPVAGPSMQMGIGRGQISSMCY